MTAAACILTSAIDWQQNDCATHHPTVEHRHPLFLFSVPPSLPLICDCPGVPKTISVLGDELPPKALLLQRPTLLILFNNTGHPPSSLTA